MITLKEYEIYLKVKAFIETENHDEHEATVEYVSYILALVHMRFAM